MLPVRMGPNGREGNVGESRDYLELGYASIQCFADDGRLDAVELRKLVDIAMRDGMIDQNEVRVLRNIVSRIRPDEVDETMRAELAVLAERLAGTDAASDT
jgi:hypothetical protein